MIELEKININLGAFSLENVSFSLDSGDYLTLLGVSGAGKSVVLEIISGLLKPKTGKILLDGKNITDLKIQDRGIGIVYQDLLLFPHLTVFKNIAFPLRQKKLAEGEIRDEVNYYSSIVGVSHLLGRMPGTLSGGEAQRVALARTLASGARVLLLDEPLSNLDVKLKSELRSLLREINRSGITIVHVTHDFMEAATLANKVAVIENGKLIQFGSPEEVFRHPKTEFVARFSGIKNIFKTQEIKPADNRGLKVAKINNSVSLHLISETNAKTGFVMVPQEDILISADRIESSALNQFRGIVKDLYFAISGMEVVIDIGIELVVSISHSSQQTLDISPNKNLWVTFKASSVKIVEG